MKNFKLLFLLSIVALYANAATPTLKIAQGKKRIDNATSTHYSWDY